MKLLTTRSVEKPWGKDVIPPQFAAPEGKRIGEIWFEPPPEMPDILVKYIFTSEKLSVQVHPSDEQAKALGESDRGKEECWLVIDAEPGATLGIGFKEPISAEDMRRAALDGSIEGLMQWFPVKPGDFFYIPAGTVHAIGAGVSLVEIQQNSDITYRLYDYGRPRELHLTKGLQVARGEPYPARLHRLVCNDGPAILVDGQFFKLAHVVGESDCKSLNYVSGELLVLPLKGQIYASEGKVAVGDCCLVQTPQAIDAQPDSCCLLVWPM